MAEIIKVYRQKVPAARFVGKKYGNEDRVNGVFGAKWGEWFQKGWFEPLKVSAENDSGDGEEYGSCVGLMRGDGVIHFEYWIGAFLPENFPVPEGYSFVDFPEANLGVCWVYGKGDEVFCNETKCYEELRANGYEIEGDRCMERYAEPRFSTPDEKGNVVLDICFYVK